jgi:hypothetical protein
VLPLPPPPQPPASVTVTTAASIVRARRIPVRLIQAAADTLPAMIRAFALLLVAAGVLVPAGTASQRTGFAFGRAGGNIRPFTVVITTEGRVQVSGPAEAGRSHLTRTQLGNLNRIAATGSFGMLPGMTQCTGVLPDVATTFIRVGPRTVRVHGDCVSDYRVLWKALAHAVRLTYV